jgi:internalin A
MNDPLKDHFYNIDYLCQHLDELIVKVKEKAFNDGLWLRSGYSHSHQLTPIHKVRWMDVAARGLIDLPSEIGELVNLRTITLSCNDFAYFPKALLDCSNLEEIYYRASLIKESGVQLKALPNNLKRLSKLTTLELGLHAFTTLPKVVCELPILRTLVLSGNRIRSISPEIKKLTNLTTLDLSKNRLKTVPPEMCELPQLSQLSLKENNFATFPESLSKLTALTNLAIGTNEFQELPNIFSTLSNLNTLKIDSNWISELPPSLLQLPSLTRLDLTNNVFDPNHPMTFFNPTIQVIGLTSQQTKAKSA